MLNISVSVNNIFIVVFIPFRLWKYIFTRYYQQRIQYINLHIMLILVISLFEFHGTTPQWCYLVSPAAVTFLFHFPKTEFAYNILEDLSAFILSPCFLHSKFQLYAVNYCTFQSDTYISFCCCFLQLSKKQNVYRF